jgi:predicted O-methyltransferase YrrM
MNIIVSQQMLDNFILENQDYLPDITYYDLPSGVQEYRLYSYITTFFNNITILDIGTSTGRSSVALSHNSSNKVITYDIIDAINDRNHKIYTKPNIEFRIKDILDDLNEDFIKNVKIVMIDIDHLETIEFKILNKLRELKFKGIILLDDITRHPELHIRECMDRLWTSISEKKYDVTQYGHWSGTGIVIMNDDINIILN